MTGRHSQRRHILQKRKGINVKGKQLLRRPAFFCDLINGGLFQGRQRICPAMLQGMPEVLGFSRRGPGKTEINLERIPDVIYAAGTEEDFLLLLNENQTQTDYTMPLRNLVDTALSYMQQKEKIEKLHRERKDLKTGSEYLSGFTKQDRLHPVICVTFYHGETPWDGGTSLHDILQFPEGYEDMRELCPDFPMNLIHAWNVRPEQFKTGLGTVFELLPFAADKGRLQTYIRNHAEHFGNLTAEECDLLEVFIGMENLGEEEREGYRNREGGYNMCTALLEIREEGRNEGEWLKLISQVQRKMRKGKPLISIAEELEEEEQVIGPIYVLVKAHPEFTREAVYGQLEI